MENFILFFKILAANFESYDNYRNSTLSVKINLKKKKKKKRLLCVTNFRIPNNTKRKTHTFFVFIKINVIF
jgi:hypothetical protein